jgi:hypothetical protein
MILQKEKPIIIPDDILRNYLNVAEIEQYKKMGNVIYSITVYAEKPVAAGSCLPGSGCC